MNVFHIKKRSFTTFFDMMINSERGRNLNMLKRMVYQDLVQWKKEGAAKALCITGARQIGKSTIAREFGRLNYEQVIEINFIADPETKRIFDTRNIQEIYDGITAWKKTEILPGKTLLLLDEIQECPYARTAVKFLVEDHRCDIIETGSLLGVNLSKVQSHPVGFEILLPMYPLTLDEFLWALQIPQSTIRLLKTHYDARTPVPEAIHQQMLSLFQLYMVVGGMPEAVQSYADHKDLAKVNAIQKQILNLYSLDIRKYAQRREQLRISSIFESIPAQLCSKNKRFKIGKIDKTLRIYRFEDSFEWLEAAGVALPCYNVSSPEYPLMLNASRNLFKLYLCDTGLLTASLGSTTAYDILQGEIQVNLGGILENLFAQCLKSRNFNLFYFDSKRNIELDFLVQNQNRIEILEIKSGKYYEKHAALDKALAQEDWNIEKAWVFCTGNVKAAGKITYLPLYMIMFYQEERIAEMVWEPDFSALLNPELFEQNPQ